MNPKRCQAILLALCAGALAAQVQAGTIYRQMYLGADSSGIAGSTVTDLTNDSSFPDNPFITLELTGPSFDYPTGMGPYYGDRSRGLLTAPQSGSYVFWIASDDDSQLWLSTDAAPAHKQLIASVTGGYTGEYQWNKYASQQSATISLVKGQTYYLEVLHKQATGNDNVAVGWQLPDGTLNRPMSLAYYEPYDPANTTPNLEQGPVSVSTNDGSMVTFTVNLEPAAQPFSYQWFRNGTAISGATLPAYQLRAQLSDDGASYAVQVGSVMSGAATLNVHPDTEAPVATNVTSLGYDNYVQIQLDRVVNPSTVTTPANYTINGQSIVQKATLSADGTTISLFTSRFDLNAINTLKITGVGDYSSAPIYMNTNVLFGPLPGSITRQYFTNIASYDMASLSNSAKFPNSPDQVDYATNFSGIVNWGMNYGTAFKGYLLPDTDGDYTFAIASQGMSDLFLSSDDSPNNLVQIASLPTWSAPNTYSATNVQQSSAIHLLAGHRYFILGLYQNGGGNSYVEAAWQLGGGTIADGTAAIPGQYLAPWYAPGVALAFTNPPASQIIQVSNSVTFSVGITGQPTYTSLQWYRNGQPISGATGPSYTIPQVAMADSGSVFYVTMSNLVYSVQSSSATLTVVQDTPPVVSSIYSADAGATILVAYNKFVGALAATNLANYAIAGVTFTNATISGDGTTVTLYVGSGSLPANFLVGIANVTDAAGLAIAPNTVATGHVLPNLVVNPGLETGNTTPWTSGYGTYAAESTNVHSGAYAAVVVPTSSFRQVVNGLSSNTTYTVSAWLMSSTPGQTAYFIIDNFGSSTTKTASSGSYTQVSASFTTGATNTSVRIALYFQGTGVVFGDDFLLVGPPPPQLPLAVSSVSGSSNTISVAYNDLMDLVSATNLANYSIGGLTITNATLSSDGMTVILSASGVVPASFQIGINNVKSAGSSPLSAHTFTGLTISNGIANPGFETGDTSRWSGSFVVINTNLHSGNFAACLSNNTDVYQTITGLWPNTKYTCTGWFCVLTNGDHQYFDIKNYGSSTDLTVYATSTNYTQLSITFTTGPTNTSAEVHMVHWSVGAGYCDDLAMTVAPPVTLSIRNLGKQVQVSWPAWTLMSAPTLNGPWTPVPGAVAPATCTLTNSGSMFFRAKQ